MTNELALAGAEHLDPAAVGIISVEFGRRVDGAWTGAQRSRDNTDDGWTVISPA